MPHLTPKQHKRRRKTSGKKRRKDPTDRSIYSVKGAHIVSGGLPGLGKR